MLTMTKKKKTGTEDRHRSGFAVRLPEVYREKLKALRERTRRTVTEEVMIALEKHLASYDLWDKPVGPQA